MGRRAVLGEADVDDDVLAGMVAAQLGAEVTGLRDVVAEVAPYDLEALTTAARFWVHGTAALTDGAARPFRFFVKVVQSWERSPVFHMVPAELRDEALAMIPWRREPEAYRSDLGQRLPTGLSMPAARRVADVDELSAVIWLDAIEAEPVVWDTARFAEAARLLGRLAASPAVTALARTASTSDVARRYAAGRLAAQVLPAVHDDGLWHHPLMTAAFDLALRDDLRSAAAGIPGYLDELDTVPLGAIHGDACTRNLLVRRGEPDGFVLIDYGFWGEAPFGFDLGQLLIGEVQTGERTAADLPAIERAIVPAYVDGLAAEGCELPVDVVQRSHALLVLLFAGLSAIPLELLGGPPTDEAVRVARERAKAARFILDLVGSTKPLL